MRKLLADNCRGPYSAEIREFALILRIGGEMQEFNFEGCERIRRNRKEAYITVDLGFPSYRWKGSTDSSIREYLAEAVGTVCCAAFDAWRSTSRQSIRPDLWMISRR